MAQAKARTIPARVKAFFTNAWIQRWSAQITHAAMTDYAASLLDFDCVSTNLSPVTCWPRPPANLPPASSQPAPKEQSWIWPCFLAHPAPPVYKWHMPGSCLVQQLQPDHAREKRCEEDNKSSYCGDGPSFFFPATTRTRTIPLCDQFIVLFHVLVLPIQNNPYRWENSVWIIAWHTFIRAKEIQQFVCPM